MNHVHTSEQFPVSVMLRVEDGEILSVDVFGPPREGQFTDRALKGIKKMVLGSLAGVGLEQDDIPMNLWLVREGQEFMPGDDGGLML